MKDKGKILMLIFIGSEAVFFLALIIAYIYYRNFTNSTDTTTENLNPIRTGILTLFLIASSVALIFGRRAYRNHNNLGVKISIGAATALGIVFLIGQIVEYIDLYNKQITLDKDIFGSNFFTLTGFHGFHVLMGIIALSILLGLSFGKTKIVTRAGFEGVSVYWHFVDVVWLAVFFFVYLKPLL